MTRRYVPISEFEPRVDEDGQIHCLNCDGLVKGRRRRYCSDRCARIFWTMHDWGTLRTKTIQDSSYTCAGCGFHLEEDNGRWGRWVCSTEKDDRWLYRYDFPESEFIVDHIVPLYAGGPLFDPENLQVLCKRCNAKKTKADMKIYWREKRAEGCRRMTEFLPEVMALE